MSASDSLQQINISYVPEQDRLLLRARTGGNGEYRLWLTRRYCALLLQALGKQIDASGGIQQVSSQKETLQHFRDGAFDQEYKAEGVTQYPLGEEGVLGYGINVAKQDDALTLQLAPQHGQGLLFTLNDSMLYIMLNLLEQAIAHADWNLSLPSERSGPLH